MAVISRSEPEGSGHRLSNTHNIPAGHHVDLQHWIGSRYVRRRQPQLPADNVAALRDGARLVEGDLAVAALTPEPAIARDDQAFRRDVLQRLADFAGHVL